MRGVDRQQVVATLGGSSERRQRPGRRYGSRRVSNAVSPSTVCGDGREPGGQPGGEVSDGGRDLAQPVRTVPLGVERGDDGRQHLRGADVAGGLLAADVLLAGLQREPERGPAGTVDAGADEPAGQLALMLGAHRHVGGVRAAEPERQPEALGAPDRDVGAGLPGRRQQRERQQVGGDDEQRAGRVHLGRQRRQVGDLPGGARVLREHPEDAGEVEVRVGKVGRRRP